MRPIEADAPVQVAGEIAELERSRRIARREFEPAFLGHLDDDGAVVVERDDRAVREPLVAGQRDGAVGSKVGRRPQPPAESVVARER